MVEPALLGMQGAWYVHGPQLCLPRDGFFDAEGRDLGTAEGRLR